MKNAKLIIDTVNHLLSTQDAVFITCDRNRHNDILILFRDFTRKWKFINFKKMFQDDCICADVGLLEIKFSEHVTKSFSMLTWASYGSVEFLREILDDTYLSEGMSYNELESENFPAIALAKTIHIKESMDEKTLLHLLDCLSIEY